METVRLRPEDIDGIMALQQRVVDSLPDPRWYYTSTAEEFLRDMAAGCMLGVRAEGRLIAMGSAIPAARGEHVRYAGDLGQPWLNTLSFSDVMVDPDFRRRGIHTTFLQRFLTYATDMGFTAIYATVDPDNIPSRRAFEKAGYQAIAQQPAYDGRPRVYYRLTLSRDTEV